MPRYSRLSASELKLAVENKKRNIKVAEREMAYLKKYIQQQVRAKEKEMKVYRRDLERAKVALKKAGERKK